MVSGPSGGRSEWPRAPDVFPDLANWPRVQRVAKHTAMTKRPRSLIVAATTTFALAFVLGEGPASAERLHPYETCLMAEAIELETSGIEVDEVIARSERACRGTRDGLTAAAVRDIGQKARLAVIQQRSNARIIPPRRGGR